MATIEPTSSRRRETLESAVIRFAGDSGDGMQITGTQFTNTTALFGNDLATFPDFPAEIRAPAGTLPGVSGFQIHFGAGDIYTPGDASTSCRDEPGRAARSTCADLKTGGILIVNTDAFDGDRPARRPATRRTRSRTTALEGYRVFAVELDEAHARRARGPRPRREEHGPLQELLRARHVLLALQPPAWTRRCAGSTRSSRRSRCSPRRTRCAHEGRLHLRRDDRGVPGQLRGPAGEARARHATATSPATRRSPRLRRRGAAVGAAALPRQLPDHAGLATSCTSCRSYKDFGVITFQAEDEIAAIRSAIGAAFAGALGDHDHLAAPASRSRPRRSASRR